MPPQSSPITNPAARPAVQNAPATHTRSANLPTAPGPTDVGTSPRAPERGSGQRDGNAAGAGLPLPHERDESTGQTAAEPQGVMRQAKLDIDAGMVDTDMRATPGLDAARRDALVPPTRGE